METSCLHEIIMADSGTADPLRIAAFRRRRRIFFKSDVKSEQSIGNCSRVKETAAEERVTAVAIKSPNCCQIAAFFLLLFFFFESFFDSLPRRSLLIRT